MPSRSGTRRRRPWMVLAIVALLFTVLSLVIRARPLTNLPALLVAVGSPYTTLVALLGTAILILARRVRLSIVAALITAVAVAVQVQWYYLGSPTDVGEHVDIRLLSSNLRKGQTDATAFVELAKGSADVITVSELTAEAVDLFSRAGIDDAFPHSLLVPRPGAGGIGLWSRYPLTNVTQYRIATIAAVRLEVPDVRFDPLIASVHAMSPVAHDENSFGAWRIGIADAKAAFDDYAAIVDPAAVIVGGDFNSTPDMRQFRDLLTDGYRDAVDQIGAGFAPTFPSNTFLPPFITIDHVLTRNAAASSIRTVDVPGSDHRALLATVQVPLDPTAS